MGRAIIREAAESSDVRVVAAVAARASSALGQDAGELAGAGRLGVQVSCELDSALSHADVAIDFSSAQATLSNLTSCQRARKALVIGTTGFGSELTGAFESAAREIPLLVAPNTSLGVTLLIELVKSAAHALPVEFDVEIIEAHHRLKRDAPSGTALALGGAVADARGQRLDEVAVCNRGTSPAGHASSLQVGDASAHAGETRGAGVRRDGDIGFAVVRGGDTVGEHTVLFAGKGERLSLGHQATDRAVFARGALRAATWLASRPVGRYFMRDILG